jgi:transcriptional regulator with XRE-family HTH domain
MQLGKVIKQKRKELGLNQVDFSNAVGISQTFLSQIESDKKEPSSKVLTDICKVLDIPKPILMWFALEKTDISEEKREAFNSLKEPVDAFVNDFFKLPTK